MKRRRSRSITVLAGGVGAARLLRGVALLAAPSSISVIVNTADDDVFHGLHVSPDLDTVLYSLAGLSDTRRGWGLAGDTFHTLAALGRYYDETWFQLGDRDLATHLFRTERLRAGQPLSAVTTEQARHLGVRARVLPMTDEPVRTLVDTSGGQRSFQEYLVRDRAREAVKSIRFSGIRSARPAPGVLTAIETASLVLLGPSNPFVSIGPILAVPGVRNALRTTAAPIVALSPLIGGRPVKGPADRMLRALGLGTSPLDIAGLYRDFLDGLVVDTADRSFLSQLTDSGVAATALNTLMDSPGRATAVARSMLALGDQVLAARRVAI